MELIIENFIGKEFYYRSEITGEYTKFKVIDVCIQYEIINNTFYTVTYFISEKNNRYRIDDYSEVRISNKR